MKSISENFDTVIFTKNNRYPNEAENFGTYFAPAMERMAKERMPIDSIRLMLYFMSLLPKPDYRRGNNSVALFSGSTYTKILGIKQPNVVRALRILEEKNYIKKSDRLKKVDINILINPKIAYAGKIAKYEDTHNELAVEFGYKEISNRKKTKAIMNKHSPSEKIDEDQDWDSSTAIPKID